MKPQEIYLFKACAIYALTFIALPITTKQQGVPM